MKKKRLTYSNFYFYLLLLAPILAVYILFFVIPVVSSMFFSLTNFNGISLKFKWVGFNNYDVAFHDKVFKKAMVNTFLFALGATVLQNLFAIVFAMALNTKIKSTVYALPRGGGIYLAVYLYAGRYAEPPAGNRHHLAGKQKDSAVLCGDRSCVDVDRIFFHHLHVQLTEYIDGYSGSGGHRRSGAVAEI